MSPAGGTVGNMSPYGERERVGSVGRAGRRGEGESAGRRVAREGVPHRVRTGSFSPSRGDVQGLAFGGGYTVDGGDAEGGGWGRGGGGGGGAGAGRASQDNGQAAAHQVVQQWGQWTDGQGVVL